MLDHGKFTNDWNPTVLYVEPCFSGEILSNASSFLWAHESRVFLVTNWHVLSGRNALTGQVMHAKGSIPNELKVYCYRRVGPPPAKPGQGAFRVAHTSKVVQLVDPATLTPKWVEHPFYGRRVDVVALDVTDAVSELHYGKRLAVAS